MSRYMGSPIAGYAPPHVPKTTNGMPSYRPNKYAGVRPSEQKNTAGQRRERHRLAALELNARIYDINRAKR